MALARWDPANDIDSLQSDFNRFFEGFLGRPVAGARRWAPAMDLSETEAEEEGKLAQVVHQVLRLE